MAKKPKEDVIAQDVAVDAPELDLKDVVKNLAAGVSLLAKRENERVRDVPLNEYRPQTPWNPTGELRTKKYPEFYQNGIRLNQDMMTDEELELFSQLRPGRYNHRKWEVLRRRDKSIDLRYPNAGFDARLEMAQDAPSLPAMLKKILTEQEAQKQRRRAGEYIDDED